MQTVRARRDGTVRWLGCGRGARARVREPCPRRVDDSCEVSVSVCVNRSCADMVCACGDVRDGM